MSRTQTAARPRLSDSQLIAIIRSTNKQFITPADRRRAKQFDELTTDGRRQVLAALDGDDWRIDEVIEFVRDDPANIDPAKARKRRNNAKTKTNS